MKKRSEETPKVCEFCQFASALSVGEDMICEKKGVVGREYSCRHFIYDPLKRVPKRFPEMPVPEDLGEEL